VLKSSRPSYAGSITAAKKTDDREADLISLRTESRPGGNWAADLSAQERTIEAITKALEKVGVEFIPENGGGAGVRLAKRSRRAK
jgi:hypothetical protein